MGPDFPEERQGEPQEGFLSQSIRYHACRGPFGAVREQLSGLDVQTLAERGFLTICFDSSFTDESGGEPRNVVSPDLNTEVVETHSIS